MHNYLINYNLKMVLIHNLQKMHYFANLLF